MVDDVQAGQRMTPEQIQALQEKIKSMSPEELKEFQKKQCIFCQIISGKMQSRKIYEDDKAMVVLDINPANPGHMLLMPKEHYSIMPQIPEDDLSHLFIISKGLSNAALRGLHAQGTNIVVANGIAAGQKAQHFMIHVIPRSEKDGINFDLPQKEHSEKDLESVREKISGKLLEAYGKGAERKKEPKKSAESKSVEKSGKKGSKDTKKEKLKGHSKAAKPAKEGIDLDDIAKLLGGA